jgi:two-component SAPR family response regulator
MPEIEIVVLRSILCNAPLVWISQNSVDLIFMDIQLADGLSFEIFDKVEINHSGNFHDCITTSMHLKHLK